MIKESKLSKKKSLDILKRKLNGMYKKIDEQFTYTDILNENSNNNNNNIHFIDKEYELLFIPNICKLHNHLNNDGNKSYNYLLINVQKFNNLTMFS